MIDIEIKGFKELEAALTAFPTKVAERILASAVLAGANVVRKEAQLLAPMRKKPSGPIRMSKGGKRGRLPGFLRANIRARRNKQDRKHAVSYLVGVFGKAFYGRIIEFGKKGYDKHPFLRPAFDESTDAVIEAMRNRLKGRIEKEAEKLRKRVAEL